MDTPDVAAVIAAVLADPDPHIGRIYELTGPRSQDIHAFAVEYAEALRRPVTYIDFPIGEWETELRHRGLPEHVFGIS